MPDSRTSGYIVPDRMIEDGNAEVVLSGEPSLTIYGSARLSASASDGYQIEVECQEWSGEVGIETPGGQRAKVEELRVTVTNGRLTAIGPFTLAGIRGDRTLRLRPPLCEWVPTGASAARALRVPVVNLIAPFGEASREVPDELPRVNGRKLFLETSRGLGFIVAANGYQETRRRLQEGKSGREVTSALVIPLSDSLSQSDGLSSVLTRGIFPALSIASGNEVGCGWVDFVDSRGGLARRVLASWLPHSFNPGDAVLGDAAGQDWCDLLSAVLASPHCGQLYLRAAMMRAVRAGQEGQILEDHLVHVVRGIENLAKVLGLHTVDVSGTLGGDYSKVRALSNGFRDRLNEFKQRFPEEADAGRRDVLNRLASKASGITSINRGLGEQVARLTEYFELHDIQIVDEYFRTYRPEADHPWTTELVRLRNQAAHGGYFEFNPRSPYPQYSGRIIAHIDDILVRSILKLVGYSGGYWSRVRTNDWKDVDWVTPTTTQDELGYEEGITIDDASVVTELRRRN